MLYKSVVFAGIGSNNFPVVQACQDFFAYKYAKLFLICSLWQSILKPVLCRKIYKMSW